MNLKDTIITLLIISISITLFLTFYALTKYQSKSAKAYTGMMASVSIYTIGYIVELSSLNLKGMYTGLMIEYLGIPFISCFWFLLAQRYTGILPKFSKYLNAVFVPPVIGLIFLYTNDFHHLFYIDVDLNCSGKFPVLHLTQGIINYWLLLYHNVLIIVGIILFGKMLFQTGGSIQMQALLMLIGSLSPFCSNILYHFEIIPANIDTTPFALMIMGLFSGTALFFFKMFDVAPIARNKTFELMYDPVIVLNKENILADFNESAKKIFLKINHNVIGKSIVSIMGEYPQLIELICKSTKETKFLNLNKNGSIWYFKTQVIPIESYLSSRKGKLVIFHDITQQNQLLQKLTIQANYDALTKTYNRRFFMEKCTKELARAKRYDHPLSFILVDLDYFKKINDTYGHQAGDKVLKMTASFMQSALRDIDFIGRYGGEEFGILLPETEAEDGLQVAERLRSILEKAHVKYNESEIRVTASFGLTSVKKNITTTTLEVLINQADKALYAAKKNGRNRVKSF